MTTRREQQKFSMDRMAALQKRILRRLKRASPKWTRRSDLYASLSRPITADILDVAIEALRHRGLIEHKEIFTGTPGRPPLVYRIREGGRSTA